MYTVDRPVEVAAVPLGTALRRGWRGVGPTVWFLGLTSLLTDVSSEMITSVLPLYLVVHLGISPLGFGVVDGLQHGVSALLRLASGALADRFHRHKEVAAAGYALSAACRLALLPAGGSLPALAAIVAADRAGKGIRTSPRDALISLAASRGAQGVAFGVHRSLDAAGAMLGPVLAFVLLARQPDGYHGLFVVSFLVALAGLGALLLLVPGDRPARRAARPPALAELSSLLRDRTLRRIALAAGVLGLAVVSDAFLYLVLQRRGGFAASSFPLLFVATSVSAALLATPLGALADRVGRRAVFLAGHAVLLPAYAAAMLADPGWGAVAACVALLGVHYAATDGVLMALASAGLARTQRASGFAVVTTVASLARFAGSVLFGLVWSVAGLGAALALFAGLLLLALPLAGWWLPRREAGA